MTPWQRVTYQIEDITPDIVSSLQRLFKNKAEEHEMAANVCSELSNLLTMLKGLALKIVLQNVLLASPIKLTCPTGIFDECKETSEEQPEEEEKKLKQICFCSPARLKDENNITRALVALVYFKLHQQTIGGAKQFEAAAHYNVNQKRLSEVIHGKKYLGGEQKKQKTAGTKSGPELIDKDDKEEEEEEQEEEEAEGAETESRKRKRTEDDDNDDCTTHQEVQYRGP